MKDYTQKMFDAALKPNDGDSSKAASPSVCEKKGEEGQALREQLERILRKCEQYWNEFNICDAEVHAALECIHRDARAALAAAPAITDPLDTPSRVESAAIANDDVLSILAAIARGQGVTSEYAQETLNGYLSATRRVRAVAESRSTPQQLQAGGKEGDRFRNLEAELSFANEQIAAKDRRIIELLEAIATQSSPARVDDWTPGDVIAAEPDGTIVLDDGITTHNAVRAKEFLAQGGKEGDGERRKVAVEKVKRFISDFYGNAWTGEEELEAIIAEAQDAALATPDTSPLVRPKGEVNE